jgi:oxygen-independent coproporphyrinogen-3 oxidase
VSVDIIFGVSGQTLEDLNGDLVAATALPITHLSTYSLTIEPGTPFFQRQERGLLVLPPDDLVAEMLSEIPKVLRTKGLERYEVSNYAKPRMESAHNTAYWIGADYLGIGAGAHSYLANYNGERLVGATRWSTLALPATYMEAAGTERATSWRESLSPEALEFEFFYLGLRRLDGVSSSRFEALFGKHPSARYGDVLRDLKSEGLLICQSDRIALTERGIALADSVAERFAG